MEQPETVSRVQTVYETLGLSSSADRAVYTERQTGRAPATSLFDPPRIAYTTTLSDRSDVDTRP